MAAPAMDALAERYADRSVRSIFLDSLDGQTHHAYGLLPNMTWIIGRGGIIHYKAAWTDAEHVERSLAYVLEHMSRRKQDGLVPFYSELQAWCPMDREGFRQGLERNGPQAVTDFSLMKRIESLDQSAVGMLAAIQINDNKNDSH